MMHLGFVIYISVCLHNFCSFFNLCTRVIFFHVVLDRLREIKTTRMPSGDQAGAVLHPRRPGDGADRPAVEARDADLGAVEVGARVKT